MVPLHWGSRVVPLFGGFLVMRAGAYVGAPLVIMETAYVGVVISSPQSLHSPDWHGSPQVGFRV